MENILIVDDEESVGRVLVQILRRGGYECAFVSCASEAREALEKGRFDLVVTDIRMPGESGLDFARWTRVKCPETGILVVTAVEDTETAREALQLGVYGYILKPFEPNQVLISVINALRRSDLEKKEKSYRESLERIVEKRTAELRDKVLSLEEAQKDLRESEERYRTAIELSNDGAAILYQGKHIYINQKYAEIHGYAGPDEIIGEPLSRFLHPDETERVKDTQTRRERGEIASSRHETRCIKKGGEPFLIEVSARRIIYRGNPCTLAFIRDITERKKTEEALRESEENFRAISESAQDAIVKTDPKGKIAFWNRAAQKIFGYTVEEAIGRQVHELLSPPRLVNAHMEAFKEFRERKQDEGGGTLELVGQRKGGEEFPVELSISKVRIRGKSHGIGILRDITERKRLIHELEETTRELAKRNLEIESSREKLAAALDEISSLIQKVAKEKDFNIRFGNPSLVKCHELMNCAMTACPCYGKEAMRCWQVAGTYCNGEMQGSFAKKIQNCCKECRVFSSVTQDAIFGVGEHFNNMMHILESKNKSLQEAYKELKNSQAFVIQQEKMASIGQLAAGVAHEINNPTGFISSNLKTLTEYMKDLLRLVETYRDLIGRINGSASIDGPLSERLKNVEELEKDLDIGFILEDAEKLVEESREGTERIKKIVQDLKDFAHPGKQEMVYADINRNLESTLNIVWNEIKYKAKVRKLFGSLPEIRCYPQQMNQVFMNILMNAAQAIEKEGEIMVSTKADNGHVEISISDTGIGIPEENLSRIFEPFFTTKEVGKGTGLGLNVAYNIVKKHKGTIQAESVVGKGTTFTVRIPVQDPA